jgi:hypothetical protein
MGNDGAPVNVPDEKTSKIEHPCPDCGAEQVIISVPSPPPKATMEIWLTVFSRSCVRARDWRWCCAAVDTDGLVRGHLSVWVPKP